MNALLIFVLPHATTVEECGITEALLMCFVLSQF